ncbi:hypothetical protein GGI07_003897 [Coemansia sp. Benny D115]|nr:hypothetical protein GGI07_003897 [Coemansia sp. Benny D115]
MNDRQQDHVGWPANRHRLSFDDASSNGLSLTGSPRRRLFAQLAPPSPSLQSGSDITIRMRSGATAHIADDSDSSEDPFFNSPLIALPPTPPRRRASDSDSESAEPPSPSLANEPPAPTPSTAGAAAVFVEDQRLARQALERFGRLRRQRFLREQQLRQTPGTARQQPEPPLAQRRGRFILGMTLPSFPSNDVDSYWYNQPDDTEMETHPSAHRRLLPSEDSRRAMLEVIRLHRSFGPGSNSDDDIGHERLYPADTFVWPEKPETSLGDAAGSERGSREARNMHRMQQHAEKRVLQWLTKRTVPAQPLNCALLQPGIEFRGVQRMSISGAATDGLRLPVHRAMVAEKWDVHVVIQTVDMPHGRISGLMKAINVPRMPKTVVTHWEGEVVDFKNFTPQTAKWRARCREDADHWMMFAPVKQSPHEFLNRWPEELLGKRMPEMLKDYIFMRWKENEFVNVQPGETRLTIEGFYYICMNRVTGAIEGVYFDPQTQPNQRLTLKVKNDGKSLAFASAEYC